MERHKTQSLATLLPIVLKQNNMAEHLAYLQVKKAWQTIIPETLSRFVTGLEIAEHRLTVRISSAAMRQELFMNRKQLIAQLNAMSNPNTIREIKILN